MTPDAGLHARAPLDAAALPASADFTLALTPDAARLSLRGGETVRAVASAAFGVALPARLGPASVSGGRAALWLGPDEWLLIAQGEAPAPLAAALEAALGAEPHSLVDISQRQIGIEVSGALAARALSAGCPLDLDEEAFASGFATRTILSRAEITLWRKAPQAFHVEVWRSFAPYVAAFLDEAARRAPRG